MMKMLATAETLKTAHHGMPGLSLAMKLSPEVANDKLEYSTALVRIIHTLRIRLSILSRRCSKLSIYLMKIVYNWKAHNKRAKQYLLVWSQF